MDIQYILNHGMFFGKYVENRLIGIVAFTYYESKKSSQEKEDFLIKNNINKENTILIQGDLVLKEYRKKGFFQLLNDFRINEIKKLNNV